VLINRSEMSWEQLGPNLDAIFKLRAEKVAFVKGDDSVDFSQIARAIDIMRAHGVDRVGLITASIASASGGFLRYVSRRAGGDGNRIGSPTE
jgi:biopolymer transport protein ExbD